MQVPGIEKISEKHFFSPQMFNDFIPIIKLFNTHPMYKQVDYIWKHLTQQGSRREKPFRKEP